MADALENDGDSAPRLGLAPSWALDPFKEYLDREEEADELLHLSIRGIAGRRGMPKVLKALSAAKAFLGDEGGEEEDADPEAAMRRAEAEAELAQREVDHGFPALHAQALVRLWGGIEDFIRSYVAVWLENDTEALLIDEVRKLRVELGDYLGRSGREQYEYVADLLEHDLKASQRRGADRFECVLRPFGLSGEVDPEVAKSLYELQQLRHVIVHRSGVADRKLAEACPWLSLSAGDKVSIDHRHYAGLNGAVIEYVTELIHRVRRHFSPEDSAGA
jgi:hypothetical protein